MPGKLCPGTSYGAIGREFTVNELTVYIKSDVLKQKHIKQDYVWVSW